MHPIARRFSVQGEEYPHGEACTLAEAMQTLTQRWALSAQRFFTAHLKHMQCCRECGADAKFTDDVCDRCGASSPVRVPRFLPAALGVAAVAVLLLVWCCC